VTYKIELKSQLMKNHVAGKVMAAQNQIALALDSSSAPILLSLDSAGVFLATLRTPNSLSGWQQVDLGVQVPQSNGQPQKVTRFAASQAPDGTIWIALAASAVGTTTSSIYVSKALASSATVTDWQAFGTKLIARPLPVAVTVDLLSLGIGIGPNAPPLLVVEATDAAGNIQHYQVNPDPTDQNWSSELIAMPQNATRCLAARPGYLKAQGQGVYLLCQLGSRLDLTFAPLPTYFAGHRVTPPAIDLMLPPGANLTTLAPLALDDLQTELYVAGNGLYRFDLSAQASSNLPSSTIDDGTYLSGVAALEVQRNGSTGEVAVWALTKSDAMVFTRAEANSQGVLTWQTPLQTALGVTCFAGLSAAPVSGAAFSFYAAAGYSDGSMALHSQDPLTKLWRTEQVSAPTLSDVVEIDTYTTRIRVTDDAGFPAISTSITLEPSFDCAARVNGSYRLLATGHPVTAVTSTEGLVSVVLQTQALEAPLFTVAVGTTKSTINPMDSVRAEIGRYQTAADVEAAQRSDGSALFPKGLDPDKATSVAYYLTNFAIVYDDLEANHAMMSRSLIRLDTAAPRRVVMAMKRNASGLMAPLDHTTVAPMMAVAGGPATCVVSAGDIFQALAAAGTAVGKFFVQAVGAAYEFVVDLGHRVLTFVFEVGSQVLNAVNWLMDDVLGFNLSDIVDWLGFIFDWGAVLDTKKVVSHIANLTFDYGIAQLQALKVLVNQEASTVRAMITASGGLTVDTSDAIFADRVRSNPANNEPDPCDPQSSWAGEHLRSGLPEAVTGTVNIVADVFKAMSDLATIEGRIFENALNQFMTDIVDDFDTLTMAQVVQRAVAIISEALLNSAENVALTIIDITQVITKAVQSILNARIEIPVITYVYEEIICQGDGSQLTLLDAISLVAAVPASILYRALTGAPLFADADAKAILAASDYSTLLTALQAMQAPVAKPSPRANRARTLLVASSGRMPGEDALIAMQWLTFGSRTGSAISYGVREIFLPSGKPKQIAGECKLGFDIATSVFGTIGASLRMAGSASPSLSNKLDTSVVAITWLFRIRDGFSVAYWRKTGAEVPDPVKDGLAYVECGIGTGILVLVCVSAGYQGTNGPPSFLITQTEKAAWTTVFAGKVTQNVIGALYRVAAPGSRAKDVKVKAAANILRFGALAVTSGISLFRVSVETPFDFGDMDF
jgi:hypothetical protein